MLARAFRFHGHNSVRGVYRHGVVQRTGLATLHVATDERRRGYRLAIVVSRKVSKSAVTRNRIRRRLYELVRTKADILPGRDMVLTIHRDDVAAWPAPKLEQEVLALLARAKVLKVAK